MRCIVLRASIRSYLIVGVCAGRDRRRENFDSADGTEVSEEEGETQVQMIIGGKQYNSLVDLEEDAFARLAGDPGALPPLALFPPLALTYDHDLVL